MQTHAEQLELPLFPSPSFNELLRQQGTANLNILFNKRLKRGWSAKISPFFGKRTLTIPSYFEDAPEKVKSALIEWALLPATRRRKKTSAAAQRKKQLEHFIWEYVEASGNKSEKKFSINPENFRSEGRRYDLREVFSTLNTAYFNGRLVSYIRWNKSNWRSYQTFFIDRQGRRNSLISIAQTYNRPDVPRYAIEGIVYHEMLHIVIPPYKRGFQNVIHGAEFKRAERQFPFFREWRKWEKEHLKKY
jgi:SprT-like family.